MDGFFKKVNQKVNLRWCLVPARQDITIFQDGFMKNLPKNGSYYVIMVS